MRNLSMMFCILVIQMTGPALVSAEEASDATAKLFRAQCATCHGTDGKGQTTVGKKLGVKNWGDGKTLKETSDDKFKATLRDGIKGDDGKLKMKPFKTLTDEQVAAIIKYVRALGGTRQ